MQSSIGNVSPEVKKKEKNELYYARSNPPSESDSPVKEDTEVSSSEDGEGSQDENAENAHNSMVSYDPLNNGAGGVVYAPEPLNSHPPSSSRKEPPKALSAIGSFTVQCANCYQWRLIPTKEKYEEIRENITEKLFYCEIAREWRSDISCDDPGDIQQDNTRIWAIDKPNIARPPPGWQRLLRLRGEGSSKFADVYYVAPSLKRFRSLVEIQKYLAKNPELAAETDVSKFSFQIPKPLQEDYVRKRLSGMKSSRALEFSEASPLAQANPPNSNDLHHGHPDPSPSPFETSVGKSPDQPAKKRAKKSSTQGNIPSS